MPDAAMPDFRIEAVGSLTALPASRGLGRMLTTRLVSASLSGRKVRTEEPGARIQESGGVSRGARLACEADLQRVVFSNGTIANMSPLLAPLLQSAPAGPNTHLSATTPNPGLS